MSESADGPRSAVPDCDERGVSSQTQGEQGQTDRAQLPDESRIERGGGTPLAVHPRARDRPPCCAGERDAQFLPVRLGPAGLSRDEICELWLIVVSVCY